jgi:two-component system sensor histidine kinase KdpD
MAQRLDAEFYVVYVDTPKDHVPENQKTLDQNIRFAEDLGATIVRLQGNSVSEAVAQFVREKRITQVVFGHTAAQGWRRYLYLSAFHKFLRDAPAVDVHIVTQDLR